MSLTNELKQAYADCHMTNYKKGLSIRNLHWRGTSVDLDTAQKAFNAYCPAYNNFDSQLVFDKIKAACAGLDVQVAPAREGSVALYLIFSDPTARQALFKKLSRMRSLRVDEVDLEGQSEIRLWWD